MKSILFFTEDTDFKLKEKGKIRQWIADAIKGEGFKRVGELSFILCSDAYLLEINKQYLNHDTYTDIVTFDSSEYEDTIAGDIFISVHLCGYPDKKPADKAKMTAKEDEYLGKRNF